MNPAASSSKAGDGKKQTKTPSCKDLGTAICNTKTFDGIKEAAFDIWSQPPEYSTCAQAGGPREMDLAGFVGMMWMHAPPMVTSTPETRADYWRPVLLLLDERMHLSSAQGPVAELFASVVRLPAHLASAAGQDDISAAVGEHDFALKLLRLVHSSVAVPAVVARFKRNKYLEFQSEAGSESMLSASLMHCSGSSAACGTDAVAEAVRAVRQQVLSRFPWLAACTVKLPVARLRKAFIVCSRCTNLRAGDPKDGEGNLMSMARKATGNAAGILAACVIRQRPQVEEGRTFQDVKSCEHFQWSWCPGFEKTGNPKCRNMAHRHEACPRYFARSTMWKHDKALRGGGRRGGSRKSQHREIHTDFSDPEGIDDVHCASPSSMASSTGMQARRKAARRGGEGASPRAAEGCRGQDGKLVRHV